MSHDTHGNTNTGIPKHMLDKLGLGIPAGGLLLVLVSILFAIMQGTFVIGFSPWGHIWPSLDSTNVPLPPAHLTPP